MCNPACLCGHNNFHQLCLPVGKVVFECRNAVSSTCVGLSHDAVTTFYIVFAFHFLVRGKAHKINWTNAGIEINARLITLMMNTPLAISTYGCVTSTLNHCTAWNLKFVSIECTVEFQRFHWCRSGNIFITWSWSRHLGLVWQLILRHFWCCYTGRGKFGVENGCQVGAFVVRRLVNIFVGFPWPLLVVLLVLMIQASS